MLGHKTWFVQDRSGFSTKIWQASTVSHPTPLPFLSSFRLLTRDHFLGSARSFSPVSSSAFPGDVQLSRALRTGRSPRGIICVCWFKWGLALEGKREKAIELSSLLEQGVRAKPLEQDEKTEGWGEEPVWLKELWTVLHGKCREGTAVHALFPLTWIIWGLWLTVFLPFSFNMLYLPYLEISVYKGFILNQWFSILAGRENHLRSFENV